MPECRPNGLRSGVPSEIDPRLDDPRERLGFQLQSLQERGAESGGELWVGLSLGELTPTADSPRRHGRRM